MRSLAFPCEHNVPAPWLTNCQSRLPKLHAGRLALNLAAMPDTSISGRRVACELTALIEARGKPRMIVSDNSTEFISNAILGWCEEHQVECRYIVLGKPMQNGYIESFNGRMRDELLKEKLVSDLDQARQIIVAWIADHNTRRPHASLGCPTSSHRNRPSRHTTSGLRALSGCSHRAEGRINR